MHTANLNAIWEGLCGLLWPPRCPACNLGCQPTDDPAMAFCDICFQALLTIDRRCPRCGLPHEGAGPDHLCGRCLKDPPPFDSIRAVLQYGGPAATACLRFKSGSAHLARPLGLILSSLTAQLPVVDVVVPVPLHRRRLAQRGYNQSALLATPLAAALEAPLRTRGFRRIRDTAAQASLKATARAENLAGAFRADGDFYRGLRVLLVDDVVTTTATCRAASQALRDVGASQVHVACLLRAT